MPIGTKYGSKKRLRLQLGRDKGPTKKRKGKGDKGLSATELRLSRSRFEGTLFDLNEKALGRVRKFGSGAEGGVRPRTFFTLY